MRNSRLAALSPSQDGQSKKISQNDYKEKELNQIYRSNIITQIKPSTSQQGAYQSNVQSQNGLALLTQSSQQKFLMQQPQSAQTIRNFSVKNNSTHIDNKMSSSQLKHIGQENLLNAISINNNTMATSQQIQGQQANKNGKMQKSQSLQKGLKAKQQSGQLKSLKNFQLSSNFNKIGGDSNENAENENNNEKNNQFGLGNSNANILNIQFNPSSALNRISDNELDMKKQLANIRLPKLSSAPLSGKAKDKNQKNQQKLNNFVDSHMGSAENAQEDDKNTSKKNEKDPDLERIKDRFKQYKNSKDITNFFDQKSGTPPTENQNLQSAGSNVTQQNQPKETSKKDEELNKIYGGGAASTTNLKNLRSNTPKQNGTILGLKANASAPSLQITPQTTSASIQQSFGLTAFSTKLGPKKNTIQSLQQKQLRLLDRQTYSSTNSTNNLNQHNASSNNSHSKEEIDEKLNKNGPLYVSHYAHRSKAGCNYQGPKKNQDNFIIHPNLNKMPNRYLFSVCDGHGVNGHEVSEFIKKTFPKMLEALLAKDLMCLDQEYISSCLKLAFLQLSQKLLESKIDCTFSGSTFVCVLMIDDKIWCANTGDSRAILCKQTKALWNAEPLSTDHKADDPEEKKRIEACGGRVDSYRDYNGDPVGPARVWMKYDDIPGLAMSRSFGDLIAAQCGVICEPEIKYFNIEDDDRFIVIASDGVWEFLNNRQVMVHVMPYYIRQQPDMACQKLVKESTQFWKQHDDVVDDITVICVFLHKNKPKLNSQTKESDQEQSQNPIKTIEQDDKEEEESVLEVNEKVSEEIDKTNSKIDDGHIEGTEDKSAGGRLSKNNTQQQKLQSPVNSQAQVTINMKKRKEQSQSQKNNEASKIQGSLIQKFEQEEKAVNDVLQKEFNNLNELVGNKTQEKKQDQQTQQQKGNMNKNKSQTNNPKQDNRKKTEENSKSLIPDIDESADSEYSKDFELDRQREEKESRDLKEKQKKKEKSPFKAQEIQQYNFDNDDEDDDAFFKNL
ncbi:hypothetical protein ABPG74_002421 [Tetrahymena malaccensis]